MYSKSLLLVPLAAGFFSAVSACEGECIVQITKAFIGNYSVPIHNVFKELSEQVSTQLLPRASRPPDPTVIMDPILRAYSDISYNSLETAIFPSYFHGKCQRFSKDGQDPPGCPNPDCPVVCGTPGSMVHFYSTLRYIAFNNTKTNLERLTTPGNPAYEQVDALVKRLEGHSVSRRDSVETHGMGMVIDANGTHVYDARPHPRHFGSIYSRNVDTSLQSRSATLASVLSQFDKMFDTACGGNARDSKDALPKCSWENEMKKFILSFP